MNKFTTPLLAAACAIAIGVLGTAPAMAAEAAESKTQVPGEKLDSGLGELPHYSQWADPTGKNPLRRAANPSSATLQVPGQKLDSGLGDLPHYRLWADKAGRQAVQISQTK